MLGRMFRPYQLTQSSSIAGRQRSQAQRLAQSSEVALPDALRQGGDAHRASRLDGLCEGILPTLAQQTSFEQKVGELRQASGNAVAFRQALYLLMRMHNIEGPGRNALMQRAMDWYRARDRVERGGAKPWAKSFVKVAQAQAGRWI